MTTSPISALRADIVKALREEADVCRTSGISITEVLGVHFAFLASRIERDSQAEGAGAETRGTSECPICGYAEPHSHSPEAIAERPTIDWARTTFEKNANLMTNPVFDAARTGMWWSSLKEARSREGGWAARNGPTGPYLNAFVEGMWRFWKAAWLAAPKDGPAPPLFDPKAANEELSDDLYKFVKQGERQRAAGTSAIHSPYSVAVMLNVVGWVHEDLRLALKKADPKYGEQQDRLEKAGVYGAPLPAATKAVMPDEPKDPRVEHGARYLAAAIEERSPDDINYKTGMPLWHDYVPRAEAVAALFRTTPASPHPTPIEAMAKAAYEAYAALAFVNPNAYVNLTPAYQAQWLAAIRAALAVQPPPSPGPTIEGLKPGQYVLQVKRDGTMSTVSGGGAIRFWPAPAKGAV